jgi:two-component system sensor histidine kinase/response regulator
MPGMDGLQLAQEMQRDPDFRTVPIILLSSAGRPVPAAATAALGIVRCLNKPVRQSDLLEAILDAVGRRTISSQPMPALTPTPVALRPLRLLLAEDGMVNQAVARGLLELRGHSVKIVNNGREALAALATEQFDVVLMDVQMPEMDGLEATAAIRARELGSGRHVPIVAMTAHAMRGDRERCLAAGMDDYLAKPIQADALYAAVEGQATPAGSDLPAPEEIIDLSLVPPVVRSDRARLGELAGLFCNESERLLPEIRAALAAAEAERLRRAAHSLKGAINCFGARAAAEVAQRLELLGRDGDLSGAAALLPALEAEVERVRSALRQMTAPG